MIKRLLNSVIAKYRDLSVSRGSTICLSLRLWQIIDLLATDKSRYFAQPCPIIVNYLLIWTVETLFNVVRSKNACVGSAFQFIVYCLLFCLPKNCTNQIKSNYLNSHGEEAQEKPRAYKEWAPSVR